MSFKNEKYESTGETRGRNGHTFYRIRAVADIPSINVVAGQLGGWIESEKCLSVSGNAWVSDEAIIFKNARVYENALVFGNVMVCDNAQIFGNAKVGENAWVSESGQIFGDVLVAGGVQISGNAQISGNTGVFGMTRITGNARITGNPTICGNERFSDNALIFSNDCFGSFTKVGPANQTLGWCLDAEGAILVDEFPFGGTLEQFAAEVETIHGDSRIGQEYRLLIEFIRLRAQPAIDAIPR